MPPVACAAPPASPSTPEEFLDLLAPAVSAWEDRLTDEGFAPLRAAWLARATRLGEPIAARLPDRTLAGRFETVDAAGALVLATAGGARGAARRRDPLRLTGGADAARD